MDSELGLIVERAISGDVSALARLTDEPWSDVVASAGHRSFTLAAATVVGVLRRLQGGDIAATEAQRWASFVRRGYIAGAASRLPVSPLVIDYEADHEDAIVEVVARLDEIGDVIGGGAPDGEEIPLLLAPFAP